jgi:uncharacterized protein (DUF4415 family)
VSATTGAWWLLGSGGVKGAKGAIGSTQKFKNLLEKQLNMNNESTSSKSQTDWERLDAMTDEDIDLSDCPEITPEMFAKAVVRRGLPNPKTKAQVTLRIDSDVLEWFKSQGRGYQTQINTLLREYMKANQ